MTVLVAGCLGGPGADGNVSDGNVTDGAMENGSDDTAMDGEDGAMTNETDDHDAMKNDSSDDSAMTNESDDGAMEDDDSAMTNESDDGAMEDDDSAMTNETDDGAMEEGTANVRVAHFSPDAPNVDVYVDGDAVLEGVSFTTVSDYLALPTGSHTVEITAAGDADTVVFSDNLTLAEQDYTVAAIGELAGENQAFDALVLEDDNSAPGEGAAKLRLLHASPDAGPVDVTVESNDDTLYDGVAFGESGYVEVPAGEYTLEIREDSQSNYGDIVATVPVSVDAGTVYTAAAVGYVAPDEAPADEAFDTVITVDASSDAASDGATGGNESTA